MTAMPNLFIIGAMKAGTSSLHEYLHQHPEIFMSRFKEPQYFAPHRTRWGQDWGMGNSFPEPGLEWYVRLFEAGGEASYRGESSVNYSARPWMEGCAKRIYEFNCNARIIYLLRDPIERTISHYWHWVKDGREDRPMLKAIQSEPDFIARSDYAMQLHPYLETFGHDHVYVLTLEELNRNPDDEFSKLFQWLGIDTSIRIDIGKRHNVGDENLYQTRTGRVFLDTMVKHWRWRPWIGRLPNLAKSALDSLIYKQVDRDSIDTSEVVNRLRPIMQPKVQELSELLGRSFPHWSTTIPHNQITTQETPVAITSTTSQQ